MTDVLTALITALIGAGGATFVTSLVRGASSLRLGARARERETLAETIRSRNESESDRDYWRDVAGGYRWQLRSNGIEPVPADPIQPSERRVNQKE
jgi:hypothetical protein